MRNLQTCDLKCAGLATNAPQRERATEREAMKWRSVGGGRDSTNTSDGSCTGGVSEPTCWHMWR